MIQRRQGKTSSLAIGRLGWFRLRLFVVSLGFLRHTSLEPVVLGKYDAPYVAFLAWQFLVVLPAMHCLARFCAVEQALKFRSGRTFVVRPWQKIAMVLVGGWLVSQGWGAVADRWAWQASHHVQQRHVSSVSAEHPHTQDAAQHVNRWGFRGEDLDQAKRQTMSFESSCSAARPSIAARCPTNKPIAGCWSSDLQEPIRNTASRCQNLGPTGIRPSTTRSSCCFSPRTSRRIS